MKNWLFEAGNCNIALLDNADLKEGTWDQGFVRVFDPFDAGLILVLLVKFHFKFLSKQILQFLISSAMVSSESR